VQNNRKPGGLLKASRKTRAKQNDDRIDSQNFAGKKVTSTGKEEGLPQKKEGWDDSIGPNHPPDDCRDIKKGLTEKQNRAGEDMEKSCAMRSAEKTNFGLVKRGVRKTPLATLLKETLKTPPGFGDLRKGGGNSERGEQIPGWRRLRGCLIKDGGERPNLLRKGGKCKLRGGV